MLSWLKKLFGVTLTAGDAGGRGEQLAAAWLRRERGFVIVARNWRSPHDRRDELDLVCRDGEALVFVEVKTRAAGALVPGYYAVNARKKRVLRRAAGAYLAGLREKPRTLRLDIVEVTLATGEAAAADGAGRVPAAAGTGPEPEILHFENVPLFPQRFRP
ncbi:MAG: endonuclease [Opitutus sp.]|nr:endonuclease [Opitutus sp.]